MPFLFIRTLLLATIALASSLNAFAQSPSAITGRVLDPSGAVVPGAVVDVEAGGQVVATTTTAADGRYRVDVSGSVPVTVRARLQGFADAAATITPTGALTTRDLTLIVAAVGDALVVTAARTGETRLSTTASVTVFSAEDIAALRSTSIADVLRVVPGLSVESTGREGALTSLFARGGESDYNLVLVDGVRVNQSGGAFDFSRIAAGEIDRVEVVRGGQSSLYGSDAMGSVVQVFTRQAGPSDAPRIVGSLEAGSFQTWRADATLLGGAARRVDYKIGVAHRDTRGAFADLLPEDDEFRHSALHAGAGVVLGDRASVRTTIRYSDAEGKGIGAIDFGNRDTGTASTSKDLSWQVSAAHHLTATATGVGTAAYSRSHTTSVDRIADPTFNLYAILAGIPGARFPDSPRLVRFVDRATFEALRAGGGARPGEFLASTPFGVSDFPFSSATRYRRPAFKYQADWMWRPAQALTGGYEFEREEDPLNAGFAFTNNAWFAQQQFRVRDRWFVTAGGRVDANSEYGTSLSPRLSAGGFLVPLTTGALSSLKVFSNVGRGIKNPQFNELFDTTFADGNPALEPERARTFDVGAEALFGAQRVRASIAWFDNRYEDQVAFRSTGVGRDGRPDFLNIAGSKADGWELEAELQRPVAGLTGAASYALVDSEVTATTSTGAAFQPGQPLLRRPRHSGALRLAYVVTHLAINVDARFVGQRHDSPFLGLAAVATGGPVDITVNPGYTVVGLGVSYRLRPELDVYVRADNVRNEVYSNALGYPGMPRSALVGVRFGVPRR